MLRLTPMIQSASIQERSVMPVAMLGEFSHSVPTRIASDVLRPPLKWAGGKRWQVPHLSALWAQHSQRRLVEPFCGGLSVSLGLMPERALINDINPHLVAFYRSLKSGLVVEDVGVDFRNAKATYLRNRKRFNQLIADGCTHTDEAAALLYYLNRTGYNGLCRFNRQGFYNVPFGDHRSINYLRDFTPYQQTFQRWQFASVDFAQLPVQKDDFIYADPPYDVEFTAYSQAGFSWDDQVRLAEWLAKHPGPVVLSNQATNRIVKLYRKLGFKLRFLEAPRHISCNGDRRPAKEVLATRNI